MKHTIKFYPVGNGDCSLVTIGGADKKLMFDCNFRQKAEDENDKTYDVLKDLLDELPKKSGLKFLDAFLLTHPDEDHCRGFEDKFYLGDPDSIKQNDKDSNKILISELWYTPRLFEEGKFCSDAQAFKKEAKRRMDLWKTDQVKAGKDGNRIRIIGWTDDASLKGLEDRITVPGNFINEVNGHSCKSFKMFIHAPFKDYIEGENRNESSIVAQLNFDVDDNKEIARIFLAGDAEWRVWEQILNVTKDKDRLKWDLLEAPHHCSYTFFADSRDDDPSKSSLEFLDYREKGAFVVSSSNVIKKNDINPPCQKAKNRYTERVGESNFFCTSGKSDEADEIPVIFEIDINGLKLQSDKKAAEAAAATKVTKDTKPHYYG